jgi:A/G-specific adenine glycosylase
MTFDADALLEWYETRRRPLPWRATRDPYALLVSEVMLQQTQAARVVPYYERFLSRFPTLAALAAAPRRDVLAAWSGLGYNRRALALHAGARVVVERGWPEDLTELPGVGPYTAAAVGSFAWDRQEVAVDTNVRRVLERFDGVQRSKIALARRADELLPVGRAAAFNQSMMELGATVCTPRRTRCDKCPVRPGCAARGSIGAGDDARGPVGGGPVQVARSRRVRFEDTDRWARGRVVAALLAGEPVPPAIVGERRDRVLAGLERDGLIALDRDGAPHLPA